MKIRSSHLVTGILVVLGVLVVAAIWRGRSLETKPMGGNATDAFLSQVKDIREKGQGSSVREGLVQSADIAMTKRAQLELVEKVVNLGTIPRTGKSEKRVPLRNKGEVPLEISEVRTSCGCTQGYFERTAVRADGKKVTTINPGEQMDLIVSVDPALIHGFYSHKALTLFSNDPVTPHQVLEVIAEVDPEFTIEPDPINFGTVQRGVPAEVRARIRQVIDEPLEISSVQMRDTPSGNAKRAGMKEPFINLELIKLPEAEWKTPGHGEWDLVVRLSPNAPAGDIFDVLWMVTNLERVKEVEVEIHGKVESFFDVDPPNFGVRNVASPGQENVAEATVMSESPIEVSDLSVTGGDLSVEAVPRPVPNQVDIFLSVLPDAKPGLKNEVVSFTVKSGDKVGKHTMRAYVSIQAKPPAAQ